MEITVNVPLKSDTWDSYPSPLAFIIKDDVVEFMMVRYNYDTDREARVVTIAKEDFLRLLMVVSL